MPRKLFISFLGTGQYKECEYVKDDFSCRCRFVQEATLLYLKCTEWSKDDKVLILLTEEAEKLNWCDDGQKDFKTGEPIIAEGLETRLNKIGCAPFVETLKGLPEGKDESEINLLFEEIFDCIHVGDELYFDLTHGFRYLPMLVLVLGNYAKFLKGVSIKSITYGNWEMSERGTKPAPIIDLMALSVLQDWTYAAGKIIDSGDVSQVVALSKNEYLPVLKSTKGKNFSAQTFRRFTEALESVVMERRTCRGLNIFKGENVRNLKKYYENLFIDYANPFVPLFDRISDTWNDFNGTVDIKNGFRAAKWCFEKELYHQSATILEETVLYYFSINWGLNPLSKDDQSIVSGAFYYASMILAEKPYENVSLESISYGNILLAEYGVIINPFSELRDNIRNDLNHAGIRLQPGDANRIIYRLHQTLKIICSTLLGDNDTVDMPFLNSRFINISNHPMSKWTEEQLSAASRFGEMIEMGFPDMKPDWDEERVAEESLLWLDKVREVAPIPFKTTIHIMGEMNFIYRLVQELKTLGYTCVASTTVRDAIDVESGEKLSRFKFVRFREY